jgi:hypothetical protein
MRTLIALGCGLALAAPAAAQPDKGGGPDGKRYALFVGIGKYGSDALNDAAAGAKHFTALAFSSDNRYVVAGTGIGHAHLNRPDMGAVVLDVQSQTHKLLAGEPKVLGVAAVGFKPGDAMEALVLDVEGNLHRFNAATGKQRGFVRLAAITPIKRLVSAEFSLDGNLLIGGIKDYGAVIWKLDAAPTVVARHPVENATWGVVSVSIAPDGKRAAGAAGKELYLFEPEGK